MYKENILKFYQNLLTGQLPYCIEVPCGRIITISNPDRLWAQWLGISFPMQIYTSRCYCTYIEHAYAGREYHPV
jgi:hypothetical protein